MIEIIPFPLHRWGDQGPGRTRLFSMLERLLPGVHRVRLTWVNVYLWEREDGYTMIDTGFPWQAAAILNSMKATGISPSEVKRILITHGDIDHVGALAIVKRVTGGEVVAHAAEKPLIEGTTKRKLRRNLAGALYTPIDRLLTALLLRPVSVDRTVIDREILKEEGFRVVYTPGHTPGHVAYYHPGRKVLFTGDAFMNVNGRIRGPYALYTPDPTGALESQRKLAALDVQVVFFGHGAPVLENAGEALRAAAPPARRRRTGTQSRTGSEMR